MNHTEKLTRYITNFVDELVKTGLREVVISPGSRSTPLALAFCEHKHVKEWIVIDERSAAFFALGMAKETGRPVALLCTSGTAAANYYPAIIEAHYSRVPLIILTADRPHELRDVGAPQAIEQINMYGNYVKWFHDMALPEATAEMLVYVREKASRAIHVSRSGNAGPVQLNFPFREPLHLDFTLENVWEETDNVNNNPFYSGKVKLASNQIEQVLELISDKPNGLIVCGPQGDQQLAESIVILASQLKIPILADPLSQIRAGHHGKDNIIEGYDALFRSKKVRTTLTPDYIIRFGAMPVSKSYLFYVEDHSNALQFIVEPFEGTRNPTRHKATFIYSDPELFCHDLTSQTNQTPTNEGWVAKWQEMNTIAKRELTIGSEDALTEGDVVLNLLENVPDKSDLYVANSMAVRDLDSFFMTTTKEIKVLSNRGANGIDGMISSALGAASASRNHLTLLIGDLSFYHDLNALLIAKKYHITLTILLINNNGGGIFSFLPQANDEKHFETLFGTPLNIEFEQTINMYGGNYDLVSKQHELNEALIKSYDNKGLSVIEVRTDRTENAAWHRTKWSTITRKLTQNV